LRDCYRKDREEEDWLWGEIAEKAVEEVYLSDREAEDLI